MKALLEDDPEIGALIKDEALRLEQTLDLIAAENHAPPAIMEAMGSVFNTKTIEGYPKKRYHAGCIYVDDVENLARARAKELFGAEHVNVQPHSGTAANLAVYFSILDVHDKILSMKLAHGGHLSHGHPSSIAGKCFEIQNYGVDEETGLIDYDQVDRLAHEFKPKLIIAGASSYPRLIDYRKFAEIAKAIRAYLLVDMAHIAGLVAAKVIPSPVAHADFATFTCYKTMMGGRGGVILCKQKHAQKIDKSIFPGCQGTSAVNSMAAKAVNFKLAMTDAFVSIQQQTIENASALADALAQKDYRIVTGGTDTHQVLVDVTSKGIDGSSAEKDLEEAGIILNKNVIPGDEETPGKVSGIRIGTSAITTRGMGLFEIRSIADLIDQVLTSYDDKQVLNSVRAKVASLCRAFPVYEKLSSKSYNLI